MKKNDEEKVKFEVKTNRGIAYIIKDIAKKTNQSEEQVINYFIETCINNLIESVKE